MTKEEYMTLAMEEAKKAEGKTHPNPIVGAVIVEGGGVVAKGYHQAAGKPHAEVETLKNLGRPPSQDAELYVTLEPCSTEGKTPPCTEAIIESGVKKVIIGTIDPNPKHKGKGIRILRDAGIEVIFGVLSNECAALNPEFNQRMDNPIESEAS